MIKKLFIFLFIYLGVSIHAEEPISLITKSRGKVKYKISSESKYSSNAKINTPIFYGNVIKTKRKSFARIVYLDDQSIVSAYPKTEVIINGKIEKRMISKHVDIAFGIVRIKVFDQKLSEFRLTTPHSELQCDECDFWVISDKKEGDRFYKISGNIIVTNLSVLETIELVNDSTILSLEGTEMEITKTLVTDNKYLELLMIDADEIPEKSNKELVMKSIIVDQLPDTTLYVVEIKLRNALNIERTIILTYTE